MDTPLEAATVETRRMLERWGALHAGRSALGLVATLIFTMGSAVKLLLTSPSSVECWRIATVGQALGPSSESVQGRNPRGVEVGKAPRAMAI